MHEKSISNKIWLHLFSVMYTHFANQCEGASPLSVDMKKCIQLQQKIQKKMLV